MNDGEELHNETKVRSRVLCSSQQNNEDIPRSGLLHCSLMRQSRREDHMKPMEGGSMEKINSSGPQKMPAWERSQPTRGHRSAVDGALQAHRQRVSERMGRTEDRLKAAREQQIDFFPRPQRSMQAQTSLAPQVDKLLNEIPDLKTPGLQTESPQMAKEEVSPNKELFIPRQIDEMYGDAQFSSPTERALGLVDKDLRSPDEPTSDEIPKGSYVDYTV